MKPVSFELFPPRTDAAAIALGRTIDRLAEAEPAFFSVTFGAAGSHRSQSLTVLRYIREHTSTPAVAHFTSVGSTALEVEAQLGEFLDAGVTSFLALRGDLPDGIDAAEADAGEVATAADLVALIRASERVRALPGGVELSVAGFPNGHPRDERPGQHLDALLAKQRAGATRVITQLFWKGSDYTEYVAAARARGVTMEILPGIMPVTSAARLARLEQLTGVPAPVELRECLDTADASSAERAGIAYAANLVREVLESAPGVHLYTFNQHDTVLRVLAEV